MGTHSHEIHLSKRGNIMKLSAQSATLVKVLAETSTLTQTQIAARAGISQSMVSLILNGKRRKLA